MELHGIQFKAEGHVPKINSLLLNCIIHWGISPLREQVSKMMCFSVSIFTGETVHFNCLPFTRYFQPLSLKLLNSTHILNMQNHHELPYYESSVYEFR